MTISIRAHYDGRVIVPDEPVDLPVDLPINVDVTTISYASTSTPKESTNSWQAEREFIREHMSSPYAPGTRNWQREDIYE